MNGTRVLVVEDEPDLAKLVQAVLEDEEYEVLTHPSGDCFQVVRSFRPDVILCDYMLPVYNGKSVLRHLRQEVAPATPCIIMSATREAAEHWRAWGADDFLAKPFDLDRLLAVVYRAMGRDATLWTTRERASTGEQVS